MEALFEKIAERLMVGKIDEVKELSQQALDQGAAPREIIDKGLLAGMDVVGKRFKAGDMFIPEVLLCASCMHGAMDILKPLLSEADAAGVGIYVIGTVEGDLHDIGKNLVSMMLQGAGFEVIDLGTNIKPQQFVDAVSEHKPTILGLSALLTTTMPVMKRVVDLIKERGLDGELKTIIGGAPLSLEYAQEIGADAYAFDCVSAVERVKDLLDAS